MLAHHGTPRGRRHAVRGETRRFSNPPSRRQLGLVLDDEVCSLRHWSAISTAKPPNGELRALILHYAPRRCCEDREAQPRSALARLRDPSTR